MWKNPFAIAILVIAPAIAAAQPTPSHAQVAEAALGTDRFMAGDAVRRTEPVAGDFIAAAGRVELAAPVEGDVLVAGGNLVLGGRAGQGLYAAGGKVSIDGVVARNARIAGGQVEVGSKAQLNGNATIAGGQVTIRGPVKGYLQAAGGQVLIDAPVDGDVHAAAGQLELGPNARIGGKLVYRSREEMRRDPAAQVAGSIERAAPFEEHRGEAGAHRFGGIGGGWIWTTGLVALAALLAGAFPAESQRVGEGLRSRPGLAVLFGFIVLVCVPVAAVVLMITIVGLPLALLVLLLYFALLLVGYASAAVSLGDVVLARLKAQAAARTGWRIGAAALAMLALALLGRIPFLGGFIVLAAMLAGIGAIALALRPRDSAARPA